MGAVVAARTEAKAEKVVNIELDENHSNSFCNLAFMNPCQRNVAGGHHSLTDRRTAYVFP